MPYPTKPQWAAKTVQVLRTIFYSLTLMAGVGAIWFTPTTVADQLSSILTITWGVLLIAGSLSAIFGVAKKLFRFEFAALPFIMTGMMIYTLTVIDLMVDTPTRLAQASSLSALLTITVLRFIELLVVTLKLSRQYDKEQAEDEDDKL